MDIYQAIKTDHDKVRDTLSSMRQSEDRSQRQALQDQLRELVLPHMDAEQNLFYASLKEKYHKEVLEHLEEHALVKHELAIIRDTDASSIEWSARAKVLSELVNHHLKEEEGETFEHAHQVLSDDQAREMGEQFEQLEREAHSRMH